jgi:hypothetical protein
MPRFGVPPHYEVADRADEDSGFRCAKSLSTWPDADFYVAQLK